MIAVLKKPTELSAKALEHSCLSHSEKVEHHAFISSTAVLNPGQTEQFVPWLAYALNHQDSG